MQIIAVNFLHIQNYSRIIFTMVKERVLTPALKTATILGRTKMCIDALKNSNLKISGNYGNYMCSFFKVIVNY